MPTTPWILWLCGAFLAGSIPFAVLIGLAKGVDIRKHGSGNPGATNLGRAVGKKWGLLCFLLDVGKGLVPVLGFAVYTQWWWANQPVDRVAFPSMGWEMQSTSHSVPPRVYIAGTYDAFQWVLVAVAAVAGHIYSPWLRFKGGKGVATGLGATLGLFPVVTVPAALAFALWYVVCKVTGYVGLASVLAAASLPVTTIAGGLVVGLTAGEIAVFAGLTALLATLVIWRHRGNLARIRAGTEPKANWTGRGPRDPAAAPADPSATPSAGRQPAGNPEPD